MASSSHTHLPSSGHHHRRCRTSLIFTPSAPPTPVLPSPVPLPSPFPLPPPPSTSTSTMPPHSHHPFRRVSAPPAELSDHHLPPDSPAVPPQLYTPVRTTTPSKPPPRSQCLPGECPFPPRTPATSLRRCLLPPSTKKIRHKTAMKLMQLENERNEAFRSEQDRSDLSLEAQERTYTAWLIHVLLQPMRRTVGADSDVGRNAIHRGLSIPAFSVDNYQASQAKMQRCSSSASPIGRRTPKLDRRINATFSKAKQQLKENLPMDASLQSLCSISVLRSRLEPFLDIKSREDVIHTMVNLSKHIDDGRLKMKDGCIMLNDVALKENFLQAMLSYNTPWLKIGLQVVLGHISLLEPDKLQEGQHSHTEEETQNTLLRWIIEKQFFTHSGLAKHHATNKKIDGLYKQGYQEALARVILKRVLLFVLTLDKAKCQSSLPLACGIDGLDGGSPRLFHINGNIKSSRQALQEFLLNSMHGEGDIVGHLGVLGYHVSHAQVGLADYGFEVSSLTEDLQDGVRLCRLVQILCGDTSILMKVKLPSDRPRRHIHNCSIALERLGRAGVPLIDSFGCIVAAEDIAEGNKDKIMCLLWNILLHLHIPFLVNANRLHEEILSIQPCAQAYVKPSSDDSLTLVNLLLLWTQAVSMKHGLLVENFTASFADGQALCYLISHYYSGILPHRSIKVPTSSSFEQHMQTKTMCNFSAESNICAAQNLELFNVAIRRLGHIPEVLHLSQFLNENPFVCEHSIIVALTFLYHRLVETTTKVEEMLPAVSWNAGMDVSELLLKDTVDNSRKDLLKNEAATKIQSIFKAFIQRRAFCRQKTAATVHQKAVRNGTAFEHQLFMVGMEEIRADERDSFDKDLTAPEDALLQKKIHSAVLIQSHVRRWLLTRQLDVYISAVRILQRFWRAHHLRRVFLIQRRACAIIQRRWREFSVHRSVEMRQARLLSAVKLIQASWRMHLARMRFLAERKGAILIQSHIRKFQQRNKYLTTQASVMKLQAAARGRIAQKRFSSYKNAATIVQRCWKRVVAERKQRMDAATRIQSIWRGYLAKRCFITKRRAAVVIQKHIRAYMEMRRFLRYRQRVVKVQALVRARYERMRYVRMMGSAKMIQRHWKEILARRTLEAKNNAEKERAAVRIQARFRGWSVRKSFRNLKFAAIHLQTWVRAYICRMQYRRLKEAAVRIQALIRGHQERTRYRKLLKHAVRMQAMFRSKRERKRFLLCRSSAVVIQKHFRNYLIQRNVWKIRQDLAVRRIQRAWSCSRRMRRAATVIQANYRRCRERQRYLLQVRQIIRLQSFVRGAIARRKLQLSGVREPISSFSSSDHSSEVETIVGQPAHTADADADMSDASIRAGESFVRQQWEAAAYTVQRHLRGYRARRIYRRMRMNIITIQALWRGIRVRQRHDHLREQLSGLRQRMQTTAANVDQKMRLEYRLTEALAALLSQKTVSGILHTCATIDLATQHSKLCCERLLEAGAIPKLLQLIQTTNRSPPHEEILKHSLSILGNLARYPEFAILVANAPSSMGIIAEQILRNNDEVQSKVIRLLQLICKVQAGLDAVRKRPIVAKRLYNLSQILEKKAEIETRSLGRLPQIGAPVMRRAGEKKVADAVAQHHSVVLLLQVVTGEDLQNKLKSMRRFSSIHLLPSAAAAMAAAPPRLSTVIRRCPLRDCSNQ